MNTTTTIDLLTQAAKICEDQADRTSVMGAVMQLRECAAKIRAIAVNAAREGQQEPVAKCWSCNREYTAEQRLDADGNCPHCGVEIEEDTAPSHPLEAQTCTCPSGDGSLCWPCPAHPLEAKAGEPGPWQVLEMKDQPEPGRLLDVVLKNGVVEEAREHSAIDWTQVADWRYSRAKAGEDA